MFRYWFIFFLLLFQITFSQREDFPLINCYTIAVGKDASSLRCVLLAHNEDDGGNLIVNMYKVPRIKFSQNDSVTLTTGIKISQAKETNSMFWLETTQQNFGDLFMNEYGITICSNACSSKEKQSIGNIGYDLRRIVAERAHTAKEGVKIAAQLVETLGYASSGRTYCIADANEIWIMAIVQGTHWIAERVPDNKIAIVPNYYTIGEINLQDTSNFLGSKDIISYAITQGWFNPTSEKSFNFREAYSSTQNLYAIWNIPRHWSGINRLSNQEYNFYDTFPFAFSPKEKISKDALMKVLSSHYEGTDFETNTLLRENAHDGIIARICNNSTKFSVIAQIQSDSSKNNFNILWWAPLNPCIHPYIPIYFVIDSIPVQYQNCSADKALYHHFDKQTNTFEANPLHAYTIFKRYNDTINKHYWKKVSEAEKFKTQMDIEIQRKFFSKELNYSKISYDLLLELYQKEKNIEK
ncbi:MAG: hypothetical protein COX07_07450 [Bacteroidetes bacterium CG23_combo_of_CG06-09_8_20_14_all_32_9]|nr:MAG: hypothetical protein COX07_07450 [Bacteroidetes bacterium CG23_combo_of_CG06-09_8_20_14_all_32_9]